LNYKEEAVIQLPREDVYTALNDPEILRSSIPGCESLNKLSDTELEGTVLVKFGPVKASFGCEVTLDTDGAPENFKLSGQGDAGTVGFARGGADVVLTEQDEHTLLTYEVQIDVSGKLAQIGSRLVEGTSKKLAKKFFENFEKAVLPPA